MKHLTVTLVLLGLLAGCHHQPPQHMPEECDEHCQKFRSERDFLRFMLPTSMVGCLVAGIAIGLAAGGSE